ncbi:histone deacetylase complex protein [Phanerochaete sordida]|uniref:Histone deacetylase complex protein n=1 Tax=Phanerochaete sordida TaxID=48140 RepID=A0A9P3GPA1_9APHY|nr:histone deacetylase complex protein [Phanerochaete sordida]
MRVEKPDTPCAAVFIQPLCRLHQPPQRYLSRLKDSGCPSRIHEVPERLDAVEEGVAVAYANAEELPKLNGAQTSNISDTQEPFLIISSKAEVDIRTCVDVLRAHGSEGGGRSAAARGSMIDTLVDRCRRGYTANDWASEKLDSPQHVPDLALRNESLRAIGGAIGTIQEAIDTICKASQDNGKGPSGPLSNVKRAFVAIRPPGHHCDKTTPSGWCFVNNAVIAGAYAHRVYNIGRVVLLDIDLHHGFGTQRLVTQNTTNIGPRFFYGDLYDPKAWPCYAEDGEREALTQQSISQSLRCIGMKKISLRTAERSASDSTEALFHEARAAITATGTADDVLVIISCGFGGSEHEYRDLSADKIDLPTDFYYNFTHAACDFAKEFASGRLLSILEGGYSDKALRSGTLAHVSALALDGANTPRSDWWSKSALNDMKCLRSSVQPEGSMLPRAKEIMSCLRRAQTETKQEGLSPVKIPRLSQQNEGINNAHKSVVQAGPGPPVSSRMGGKLTRADSSTQQGAVQPSEPAVIPYVQPKRPRSVGGNEAEGAAGKLPRLDKGKGRADAVEVIVISSDEEDSDDRPSRKEFSKLQAQVARLERVNFGG